MIVTPTPPKRIILQATLLLALLITGCVYVLHVQPWLGIRLQSTQDSRMEIMAVDGPARDAGLTPGQALALRGLDGVRIALDAGDLIEEPDFHHEYRDYNAFLARQEQLSAILRTGTVGIETPHGTHWIEPGHRPLSDLPLIFWFQIICGGIAWLVGASVAANSRERAARYYALTGAAFLLVTYTAAIYSARELALDGALFRSLSVTDHAGAFLFASAFLGLLWIYPTRLGDDRGPHIALATYLGIWIADTVQWAPDMNFGIRYPMLAGMATSFILAGLQWRRARQDPISRAALRWFLTTLTIGSAVFVLGVFGVQAMGRLPVIPQGFAFGFVLMMYLGMAIGMHRYRLFDLEPWWPQIWLWFLSGLMVIVIDFLLIRFLLMNVQLALILAVALAGWLYFPLRQYLLRRSLSAKDARFSGLMPELIRISSAPLGRETLCEAWRAILTKAFQPMSISESAIPEAAARIVDDGLRMRVPRLEANGCLLLSHADAGRALFLPADRELAQSLLDLLRQALSHQESYARGAREERERIARDLHDDAGAKLLTLIHKAESAESAERLREILQDLRSLATSLDRPPAPLGDAVGDWRGEIAKRCDSAGVTLHWQDGMMDVHLPIESSCRLALERVLREAVTNALKHARPTRLTVITEDRKSVV
jgi:signal transduction histidine kinase